MMQDQKTRVIGFPRLPIVALIGVLAISSVASFMLPDPTTAAAPRSEAPKCAAGVDFLGFSDTLNKRAYEGTSVGGLSTLSYDGRRSGVYYSLVDNGRAATSEARFYTLRISTRGGMLGSAEILDVTTLRRKNDQPFTASNFDGEGLAFTRRKNLLASSETEPSIRRFSPQGELLRTLPVPQKFGVAPKGQATSNQTFESLALSPNNRSLFTAVEGPLAPDGATADDENRIRILRYEDRGPGGFKPAEEFYYLTEPGQGVSEIAARSRRELLVLERGFVSGEGNTVRIFRVSLDGAEDVSDEPTLATPDLPSVEKELLVDLADCIPGVVASPGGQPNPLLDNYEGLALGPRLSDGDRALLLQSDDNFSADQVTRVIALGVEKGQPRKGR